VEAEAETFPEAVALVVLCIKLPQQSVLALLIQW
jgi:hypothetical protein